MPTHSDPGKNDKKMKNRGQVCMLSKKATLMVMTLKAKMSLQGTN